MPRGGGTGGADSVTSSAGSNSISFAKSGSQKKDKEIRRHGGQLLTFNEQTSKSMLKFGNVKGVLKKGIIMTQDEMFKENEEL